MEKTIYEENSGNAQENCAGYGKTCFAIEKRPAGRKPAGRFHVCTAGGSCGVFFCFSVCQSVADAMITANRSRCLS